jgi:hypothetical protein
MHRWRRNLGFAGIRCQRIWMNPPIEWSWIRLTCQTPKDAVDRHGGDGLPMRGVGWRGGGRSLVPVAVVDQWNPMICPTIVRGVGVVTNNDDRADRRR